MTRRSLLWIAAAVAVAAGSIGGPAPASGQAPLWTLTIDDHPAVVDARPVEVAGDVKLLGGVLGGAVPVRDVTVALLPQGLPDACAVEPKTVAPSGTRYRVEMVPRCNGPHRISVTARSQSSSSGAPETEEVGLAWAGPAPAPPDAIGTATGALVSWAGTAEPDVVGWTLVGVGTYPREQTSVVVPAAPGPHGFRLAVVRWGAEGPGRPGVTSPASAERTVTVPLPPMPARPDAPSVAPPAAPPRAGVGAAPPASGGTGPPAASPRRTGPPTRGTGSSATLPEGYSEELPYGVPDDAFVPGEEPAPDGADAEESAAGTSPSASLVRTSEKRSPGLVAPFALGLLMVTVAAHIGWYLRRSRPERDEQVSLL